jgi:CMP-N-acetylneuraminic acid synthetase
MRVIAVIPARGNSKRLPRKNLVPVLGKPLLAWAVEAALNSRRVGPGNVYVSTEDGEIAQVAQALGAHVIARPPALAADDVWTEDVIQQAVEAVAEAGQPADIVVWMNACSPEVIAADVDQAVQRLIDEDLREVFAVDKHLRSTSVVRALWRETLFQRRLRVKCGVVVLDYVDVHYAADVAEVEQRLRNRTRPGAARTFRGGSDAAR